LGLKGRWGIYAEWFSEMKTANKMNLDRWRQFIPESNEQQQ